MSPPAVHQTTSADSVKSRMGNATIGRFWLGKLSCEDRGVTQSELGGFNTSLNPSPQFLLGNEVCESFRGRRVFEMPNRDQSQYFHVPFALFPLCNIVIA